MKTSVIRCLCRVGFAGLLALSGTASAQTEAYTNLPANLRAGPAPDYPLVASVPEGVFVSVIGCLSDYTWCDVALPNLRGWIYAERLSYPYQGSEVPLLEYGATLGFPVVGFYFDSYWDNHYRREPWFHDRDRWRRPMEPRGGPVPGRGEPGRGVPGVDGRPGGGAPIEREHGMRRPMPPRGPEGGMPEPQNRGGGVMAQPPAGHPNGGAMAPPPMAHPNGGAMMQPAPGRPNGGVMMQPAPGRQNGGGERSGGERGFGREDRGGGGGGGSGRGEFEQHSR